MQEKHWENEGGFAGAEILEICLETHAPPGGTCPAARRQRRDNGSVWLRGEILIFLWYFDIQLLGENWIWRNSKG